MNIKIIIAMHKSYALPDDEIYLPLHVGAEGKAPITDKKGRQIQGDNTKANISEKNGMYCELTGLYWAWKNLDADAVGLVHYRRHFKGKKRSSDRMQCVLSTEEAQSLMERYDIIVPKKRRYVIESLYSHYEHTLDGRHLDMVREIIARKYPNYLPACVSTYAATSGYMFNMCIMKRRYLDAYATWLFDILEELEKQMRTTGALDGLSEFDARLFGRVSEILFNVWLRYSLDGQAKPRVKEVETMHMEPINWWKKGMAFLQAKFFGKKYRQSF